MSHTAALNIPTFPGYSEGMEVPITIEILKGVPPSNTDKITAKWLPGKYK